MRTIYDKTQPCAVYWLYGDNDVLLYVGISKHPDWRLREHLASQPWDFLIRSRLVQWYDTRGEALDVERTVIETEAPLFNIVHADEAWQQRWHAALRWMRHRNWALNPWRLPALASVAEAEPRIWELIVDLHEYAEVGEGFCGDCLWDERFKRKVQAMFGYGAENFDAQDSRIYELAVSLVYEGLPNWSCDVHSGVWDGKSDYFDDWDMADWDVA